ncbi:hypothetical protein EV694_1943 [Volucribacter psittacicida]|uniref:Lipoprotein n=1 Tax=Volucribacter psittacicida TaxID=203482 RepID=A0A4R1FP05_9PAST|nr:hypothetical protein [Volucribacter psittacicida]TCJ95940.1 hypothetical protein EV694_1943 [Volucribacter psittacicida]
MKKILTLTLISLFLLGCNEQDQDAPKQQEMDSLKLAFIHITPQNSGLAAQCEQKKVGERYFAACNFMGVGKRSQLNLFLYDKTKDQIKRFYALNGTAMQTYDSHLTQEPLLGNYKDTFGLPMENDIDFGKLHQAFENMTK